LRQGAVETARRNALRLLRYDCEFIRRFLIHVLPRGFHRIRYCGLFANACRAENVAKARALLAVPAAKPKPEKIRPDQTAAAGTPEPPTLAHPCPCCGGRMFIIATFARGATPRCRPRYRPNAPTVAIRIGTS